MAAKLTQLAAGQSQKEVTANENFIATEVAALFARRVEAITGLTWAYYGGRMRNRSGALVSIANGTVTLSASATNYVEADQDGAVTTNTSGFTANRIPLITIVTDASAQTSYTDERVIDWRLATLPAGADQAAVTLGNTDSEIGGLTISASYDQAEVEALRDKTEELADDVRNLSALVHALRTVLVDSGQMKGAV